MKRRIVLAGVFYSLIASAVPAFAGFTATTTTDTVLTPGVAGLPPTVGETFATDGSGGFSSFVPDTAADPQVNGDLSSVKYDLAGAITSVNLLTDVVGYAGTYEIYYDLAGTGVYNPAVDASISTGTFTLTAMFPAGSNDASLTGLLTQTVGPSGPNGNKFADLSEGGHPVVYTGIYDGTDPDVSGTIQGTLRQNATVPEPTSLAVVGMSALALLARRRRVQSV